MSDAHLRSTDPLLFKLTKAKLLEIAAGEDEHAEAARAELERRRLNRQRKAKARETAAQTQSEQLDLEAAIVEQEEGFAGWALFGDEEELA